MIINDIQHSCQYWSGTEQSEIALVNSAQSGNLESFNAIVLKYQDVMYRTALNILGQGDLADDATQDAFISAYQHINNFRGGSLKAWLMRIVVNKCYDQLRYVQRTTTISLNESMPNESECENENLYFKLQDHVPSVEECVEASERNESIEECLSKLPASYRVIIVLVDVEEMSYSEASAVLKIPIGTVKSRLARARLDLRQKLKAGKNF